MSFRNWLRYAAIVAAAVVSVATSLAPDIRVETSPEGKFLEREGVVVSTFACHRGFRVAGMVDHLDAMFAVKNERAEPITFSTESARLFLDRVEFGNDSPVTFRLNPGETRKVYARFPLEGRREFLVHSALARVRLGEAILKDGLKLDFTCNLETIELDRWQD